MNTEKGKGALTQVLGALRVMELLNEELGTVPLRIARTFLMVGLAGDAGLERSALVKALGNEAVATRSAQALADRSWNKDARGDFKEGQGLVEITTPPGNYTVRILRLTTDGKKLFARVQSAQGGKS